MSALEAQLACSLVVPINIRDGLEITADRLTRVRPLPLLMRAISTTITDVGNGEDANAELSCQLVDARYIHSTCLAFDTSHLYTHINMNEHLHRPQLEVSSHASNLETSTMRLPSLSLLHLCLAWRVTSTVIYEGGTIIAHDEATRLPVVLRDAHLVIEGTRIVALSEGPYNGSHPTNATRINATEKILSPGFIDTRKYHDTKRRARSTSDSQMQC